MEFLSRFGFFKGLSVGSVFFLFCGSMALSTVSAGSTALLTDFTGKVEVLPQDQGNWISAEPGMVLGEGDHIQTGSGSRAKLTLSDGSTLDLKDHTRLEISQLQISESERMSRFKLWWGVVRTRVQKSVNYTRTIHEIETDTAVAGVELSEMEVRKPKGSSKTEVMVLEGTIRVRFLSGNTEVYVPLCGEILSTRSGEGQEVLFTRTDLSNIETVVTTEVLSGEMQFQFLGVNTPGVKLHGGNAVEVRSDCETLIIRTLEGTIEITNPDGTSGVIPPGGLRIGVHSNPPGEPIPAGGFRDSQLTNPTFSPGFALLAAPPIRTVQAGGSTFYNVVAGFTGSSNSALLSVTGLPPDTTGAFTENPVSPTGGAGNAQLQLLITTSPTTSGGTYAITISGTDNGGKTAIAVVTLVVSSAGPGPVPTPTPTPLPPPTPTPVSP
ncbi:MAG TPA: FecR family protein [Candidatus Limnocylindrales bacterium]|nr:FecR family protein [Candidatus Limnocylindrales bacterium]